MPSFLLVYCICSTVQKVEMALAILSDVFCSGNYPLPQLLSMDLKEYIEQHAGSLNQLDLLKLWITMSPVLKMREVLCLLLGDVSYPMDTSSVSNTRVAPPEARINACQCSKL